MPSAKIANYYHRETRERSSKIKLECFTEKQNFHSEINVSLKASAWGKGNGKNKIRRELQGNS